MSKSRLLSWAFWLISALVVVPSLLYLARNAGGLSLSSVLDQIVNEIDSFLERYLGLLIVPWVTEIFRWLKEQFHLPLNLQAHWRHVFVILWLFFSAYGKTTNLSLGEMLFDRSTWWRFATAFVTALFFAIAAGTVALTAIGVVVWPVAGFYVFLWLNGLGQSGSAYLVRAAYWSGAGVLFAWLSPYGFSFFSGLAPSVAILVLAGGVILFAFRLLFFGMPGRETNESSWLKERQSDPGTRIALSVLGPVLLAVISVWWTDRLPQERIAASTSQVFEDGTFTDCESCPRMMKIPAGQFRMGSDAGEIESASKMGAPKDVLAREAPAHLVQVPSFSLGVMEVTRAQFSEYLKDAHEDASGYCAGLESGSVTWGSGRSWHDPGFGQTADHPVVCVTHWDAVKYTQWLSRKTGHSYRLPTEAEWEYAARAGTTTSRYWGDDDEDACMNANVFDVSAQRALRTQNVKAFACNDGFAFTATVGSFKPNAFGLYDMLGNAWEWTLDCYKDNYSGAPSHVSVTSAEACGDFGLSWFFGGRVVRGGGWNNDPWIVRSSSRSGSSAAYRSGGIGFRVARTD